MTRSRCSSRVASPFSDGPKFNASHESRYKTSDSIKEKHAEKRALRTGTNEDLPNFMKPTVTSLFKRQSFLQRESYTPHSYRVRSQSCDFNPRNRAAELQRERLTQSACVFDMTESGSSSGEDGLENYVIDGGHDWESEVQKMPEDVENAYRDTYTDARRLRRNSTGNSRRIEGGLSPLPPRRGAQTSEDNVLADLRPHSAADVNCFVPTEPFPFSTAEEELPLPNRVESTDVALTEDDLRREGEEAETESRPHPLTLTQISSFDSTAALTDSPHAPCLSPLVADPSPALGKWKTPISHLNHTLPQNIHEIQDTAKDSENSDAQKATTALRCQTGAEISGSTTAGTYVQKIVEDHPREAQRRPTPVPEKPLIKRGLILAGIFTGVAILVGRIFTTVRGA